MKRLASVSGIAAALALACLAVAQDPSPADLARDQEIEDLQGTWCAIKGPGSPATDERAKKITYVIEGHKMTMIDANADQKSTVEGTIRINPKTHAFDWTHSKMGWTGIYELKGNDFRFYAVPKLTGATVQRPKSIEDKGGHLFVLQREKRTR